MTELTDAQIEAERRAIIKLTVDKMIAEGAVIAHVTVSARLERDYPGFEYIARVDNFRAAIDDSFPPVAAPVVGELGAVEPVDELGAPVPRLHEGEHEPEQEGQVRADPMDIDQLREAIHEAELARGEIRSQLFAACASRVIARTILAQTRQAFISGRPVMTPTENAQSFCAQAAAERQAAKDIGADHIPPAALHARSKLDAQLAYGSGGDASDFARKRFVTGHRRGAYSQASAARVNQERALTIAAKANGQ